MTDETPVGNRGEKPSDSFLVKAFQRAEAEIGEFWERMGAAPDVHDKRVMDLGSGLGAMCLWAARAGAESVVGVDLEKELVEFGEGHIRKTEPELSKKIEFWDAALNSYKGESFDLVFTKDTFEHVMDLPGLLEELYERITPGGELRTGFGPLYHSPFGHHGQTHPTDYVRKLPWIHLLESEGSICARLNSSGKSAAPISTIRDIGLNMYSYDDYMGFFEDSRFEIERVLTNRGTNPVVRMLGQARNIPALQNICTTTIYAVLRKPA